MLRFGSWGRLAQGRVGEAQLRDRGEESRAARARCGAHAGHDVCSVGRQEGPDLSHELQA